MAELQSSVASAHANETLTNQPHITLTLAIALPPTTPYHVDMYTTTVPLLQVYALFVESRRCWSTNHPLRGRSKALKKNKQVKAFSAQLVDSSENASCDHGHDGLNHLLAHVFDTSIASNEDVQEQQQDENFKKLCPSSQIPPSWGVIINTSAALEAPVALQKPFLW